MDPIIAVLTLALMTATVATLFAVVRWKGEGAGQALLGIVCIVLIGGLMGFIGQCYDRGPGRRHGAPAKPERQGPKAVPTSVSDDAAAASIYPHSA